MATAETARLVASLELQDKNFTRGLRNVERGVGRVDKKLSAFGGFVNRNLARGIDTFAANLVGGVFQGIESLKELEQQEAQTAAVLKSTGQAAGINGEEVTRLAEKYEGLNAIIGDEIIRSGENMLLTFTKINKQAFEPALEATLDINTALGRGPEGLTKTATMVGKALNDPTKGLTALTRVGVSFSKNQVKRIKQLQKEGKLYEAQQIILKELNREFGGSFAAQGDTTAGKVAKFHDAVEDLQRTFAKALLPIIVKVADKLGKFLSDPAVVRGIEKAGQALGAAFDGMLAAAEKINWKAIGNGLRIAADFAGQLVGWFGKMPDWAQALLVGGVVATRLPVVGGLISELGKGLIKGVLGMTAGVVNINAGVVNGGGAPVPGGGGKFGGFKGILKLGLGLTGVGLAALLASEFEDEIQGLSEELSAGWRGLVEDNFGIEIPTISPKDIEWPFGPKNTPTILPELFGGNGLLGGTPATPPRRPVPSASRPPPGIGGLGAPETGGKRLLTGLGSLTSAVEKLNTSILKPPPKPPSKEGGAPGAFRPIVKAVGDQKAELGNIKNSMATLNTKVATQTSQQTAELANIKNASATLNTTTYAGLLAATTATTAGNMLSVFQSASQVLAANSTTTAANNTTVAARGAGNQTSLAMSNAASRIVGAVNALDLSVNVTTVNRTSTVNNRYGPGSGSSQGDRTDGGWR